MLKTSKTKTTQFRYNPFKNMFLGLFSGGFDVISVENAVRNHVDAEKEGAFSRTEKCSVVDNRLLINNRC